MIKKSHSVQHCIFLFPTHLFKRNSPSHDLYFKLRTITGLSENMVGKEETIKNELNEDLAQQM